MHWYILVRYCFLQPYELFERADSILQDEVAAFHTLSMCLLKVRWLPRVTPRSCGVGVHSLGFSSIVITSVHFSWVHEVKYATIVCNPEVLTLVAIFRVRKTRWNVEKEIVWCTTWSHRRVAIKWPCLYPVIRDMISTLRTWDCSVVLTLCRLCVDFSGNWLSQTPVDRLHVIEVSKCV